jgi:CheY-like chemotaxis protein
MEPVSHPLTTPIRSRTAVLLVVEDNDDHWLVIQRALQESWPDVQAVRTATVDETLAYLRACEQQENRLPRMILLDLYVPHRQDGWALLDAFKANPAYKLLPVVVLSVSDEPADIRECYDLRSNSYIVKPKSYLEWVACFDHFRRYWSDAVTLPSTGRFFLRYS